MYFLDISFNIDIAILVIISPIILYFYIKQERIINKIDNLIYKVEFTYENKTYKYNAYLDTGNNLYYPCTKTPIILLYNPNLKIKQPLIIPYSTVEHSSILKGFKISSIYINNKLIKKNIIVGLVNKPFLIEDINILLHNSLIN